LTKYTMSIKKLLIPLAAASADASAAAEIEVALVSRLVLEVVY